MRWIVLSLLVLAFSVRVADAEEKGAGDAKWKEAMQLYKDDVKKKSIKFKKRAIEALPPGDARTIPFVIEEEKLLSHKDWWIRTTAAEQLAKVRDPDLRKKLLTYAKNSDPKVREGVIGVLAISNDPMDAPVIVEALKDQAWQVRRMACWAAGQQRVKEAVDPMIAMIHWVDKAGRERQKGETHPRVRGVLLFNLEEITGQTQFVDDAEQWRAWWERNKDKSLPPAVKRFDVGDFGEVKGMEFNDTFARRGTGPLTIVLPATGQTTVYYMPYLPQWAFVKWLFINLPPVKSFPDVKINSHGDPIYPVDKLVDAFEDIRKKYSAEKMIVLAHEFTCWVAAKYAQKYPDRVQGLILLDPYAQDDTFGKAVDAAKRSGDIDAEFWGKVSSYEVKPATELEVEQCRYCWQTWWLAPKNRDDMEMGMLRRVWDDPKAVRIQVAGDGADFDIRGEETSRAPALIFLPNKDNELMAFDDLQRLQRFYPKNVIAKGGDKFAYLPFMEAPDMFEDGLRKFVEVKVTDDGPGASTGIKGK
jgi:pimeloyl-ACP methyl ester carboxylesterase